MREADLSEGVLRILADGRSHTHADVAQALGVSAQELVTLMEDLTRRGLVAAVQAEGQSCGRSCRGCALAKHCSSSDVGLGAMWSLTPTGRASVEAAS